MRLDPQAKSSNSYFLQSDSILCYKPSTELSGMTPPKRRERSCPMIRSCLPISLVTSAWQLQGDISRATLWYACSCTRAIDARALHDQYPLWSYSRNHLSRVNSEVFATWACASDNKLIDILHTCAGRGYWTRRKFRFGTQGSHGP